MCLVFLFKLFIFFNKYLNEGISKKELFDFGTNLLLLGVSVSNPFVIVGMVGYGLLDATGSLDGVKEYFGATNEVIFKE